VHEARPELGGAWGAVSFLTRAPVSPFGEVGPDAIARGVVYFPLVGAALGAIVAVTAMAASQVLPSAVSALVAVGVGAILTGALHLDGLADTADSYGSHTREGALAIMRDHSLGTYGVVALVIDLGVRVATITVLLPRPSALVYLIVAGALSRAASAGLGCLLPGARSEPGLAGVLGGVGRGRAVLMIAIGVAIACLCIGWRGLFESATVGVVVIVWGLHCRRRLGGVTGDTLGAASEAAEVLVLVAAVAV
jgi:adenosylcobinamide-GDP ribazoletransferase